MSWRSTEVCSRLVHGSDFLLCTQCNLELTEEVRVLYAKSVVAIYILSTICQTEYYDNISTHNWSINTGWIVGKMARYLRRFLKSVDQKEDSKVDFRITNCWLACRYRFPYCSANSAWKIQNTWRTIVRNLLMRR